MALLELDDKVYKIPNKVMKALEDMSDYIKDLEEENEKLKELCDKYEEEHNNEFQCWKKDRKELLVKRIIIDKALKEIDGYIRLCAEPDLNYLEDILKGE